MKTTLLNVAIALLTLTMTASVRANEDWNQFRGPSGQGESNSTGLPVEVVNTVAQGRPP